MTGSRRSRRKNVSGNFEAKDGSVYMTLDNAGLSLIVR